MKGGEADGLYITMSNPYLLHATTSSASMDLARQSEYRDWLS